MRIVVSVINFRTPELTTACVRSVLAASAGRDVQTLIVDNFSNDGSAEALGDWIAALPDGAPVRLIRSDRNTGFSGGHNIAVAAAPEADGYLLLNSDAALRPDFFDRLDETLARRPEAGLIAPRLEYEDGAPQISCFRKPSPFSELIRGAETGPVTRILRRFDMPMGPDPDPDAIEWVSFACVFIRRAVFDAVGPMDEGYFLYSEDVDFCHQATCAGWPIAFDPDIRAVHHRGGSGPVKALAGRKARLPAYYYASRTRLFRRLYGPLGPIAANFMWLTGRAVATLRGLVGKPAPRVAAREYRDIWTNFLDPLGDRRAPEETP